MKLVSLYYNIAFKSKTKEDQFIKRKTKQNLKSRAQSFVSIIPDTETGGSRELAISLGNQQALRSVRVMPQN